MLKSLAIVGGLALLGGVVGGSQVLCADGSCVLTGSWYGGAMLGGIFGLIISGGAADGLPRRKG